MNHTPGPWIVGNKDAEDNQIQISREGNPGQAVARVLPLSFRDLAQTGNAALIAAAPDMLALLKRAHEKIHQLVQQTGGIYKGGENAGWIQADIEKVIAKATAAPAAKDTDNG